VKPNSCLGFATQTEFNDTPSPVGKPIRCLQRKGNQTSSIRGRKTTNKTCVSILRIRCPSDDLCTPFRHTGTPLRTENLRPRNDGNASFRVANYAHFRARSAANRITPQLRANAIRTNASWTPRVKVSRAQRREQDPLLSNAQTPALPRKSHARPECRRKRTIRSQRSTSVDAPRRTTTPVGSRCFQLTENQ
jgi:hypothetical protein